MLITLCSKIVRCLLPPLLEHTHPPPSFYRLLFLGMINLSISLGLFAVRWIWRGLCDFPTNLSLYVPISKFYYEDVKRYFHISLTHHLLPHIEIDTMNCHKVGTNDNLVHNIGNNKNVAYTDVGYRHLRLYWYLWNWIKTEFLIMY